MFYFAKQEQYCSSQIMGSIARNSFKLYDSYTHYSLRIYPPSKIPNPLPGKGIHPTP